MNQKPLTAGDSCDALNQRISSCWGANIQVRAADLEEGTDVSYIHTIKPWVLERVMRHTAGESRILDVGCGCGYLTNAVYRGGRPGIRGMDLSAAAVEYARKRYPAIHFDCADICRYAPKQPYDLCIAVMTLNNLPNLSGFFSSVHRLLISNGRVIVVIPHPCFWPQSHLKGQGFSYFREQPYEYVFSTKGRTDYCSSVLYFHRTLEAYLQCIQEGKFQIAALEELREQPCKPAPDILGMELVRV